MVTGAKANAVARRSRGICTARARVRLGTLAVCWETDSLLQPPPGSGEWGAELGFWEQRRVKAQTSFFLSPRWLLGLSLPLFRCKGGVGS